MQTLDYIVLGGYFIIVAVIGVICMFRVKVQEDFFMGGRAFGKLMQTFAAFGAGTGSNDPVQVGRTTWTSGLAGIWGVLLWLFVTPFYWIFGVWYRRMRHLTIGDWFTERYQSKSLGAAYSLFGIYFYALYFSAMFTAITKVAAPLTGFDTVAVPEALQIGGIGAEIGLQYVLVPTIAIVVVIYGILGGLKAAYWTDLLQGLGIIALSVILIPYGLLALVDKFDPDGPRTLMRGFEIMHERTPAEYFQIFGGPRSSEFPLHYIISLTVLALIGIVVQPHFISTGGGSAKTENAARIGLVSGNFLKRFCTIGWALTGLIILTLLADSVDLAEDPDKVWGVASLQILGPLNAGLVGLMLACLLGAAMSSADCYMIMVSGLVTRNLYAPMRPNASEKEYLLVGRFSGLIMIAAAAVVSLIYQDVFSQFVSAITACVIFAAAFWVGMWWRRANKWSAWITVLFTLVAFFLVPMIPVLAPPEYVPAFMKDARYTVKTDIITTTIERKLTSSDIARREAWRKAYLRQLEPDAVPAEAFGKINTLGVPTLMSAAQVDQHKQWLAQRGAILKAAQANIKPIRADESLTDEQEAEQLKPVYQEALAQLGELGTPPALGDEGATILEQFRRGGKPVYWETLTPIGDVALETIRDDPPRDGEPTVLVQRERAEYVGSGQFRTDMMIYGLLGMEMHEIEDAMLPTLQLPPKLITPFLLIILVSFITPRTKKEALDRYFVKMKVPVIGDAQADTEQLVEAYQHPEAFEGRKLFPGSSIEIQRPRWSDALGFVGAFGVCFAIVWFAVWLTNIGAK